MKSLGICIGATTLSAVELDGTDNGGFREGFVSSNAHAGNPREAVRSILERYRPADGCRIAVTGRKFRGLLNLTSISEPEAVEWALRASLDGDGPFVPGFAHIPRISRELLPLRRQLTSKDIIKTE